MEAIEDLDRDETVKKTAIRARGNGAAGANGGGDSKQKAIAHAVSTIEKQFGKGAILTMTDRRHRSRDRVLLHGRGEPRPRARHRRAAARPRRRDLRAGGLAARRRCRCTRWPRSSAAAGSPRSSTPSTRSTSATRGGSACKRRRPARLPARHRRAGARDRRRAAALAARSTWSWSTRWRRSCRAPRSRARWAISTWACRRGS